MNETFKENLMNLMKQRKMNQRELSNLTGIAVSSISDYMRGRNQPKYDNLKIISQVFNVSVDEMITPQTDEEKQNVKNINNSIQNLFINRNDAEYYKKHKLTDNDIISIEKMIDTYFEIKNINNKEIWDE